MKYREKLSFFIENKLRACGSVSGVCDASAQRVDPDSRKEIPSNAANDVHRADSANLCKSKSIYICISMYICLFFNSAHIARIIVISHWENKQPRHNGRKIYSCSQRYFHSAFSSRRDIDSRKTRFIERVAARVSCRASSATLRSFETCRHSSPRSRMRLYLHATAFRAQELTGFPDRSTVIL